MAKIIKGEKVIVFSPRILGKPAEATVLVLTNGPGKQVGVKFADPIGVHSCDNRCKHGHGLWVTPQQVFKPAEFKKLKESMKPKPKAKELESIEFDRSTSVGALLV